MTDKTFDRLLSDARLSLLRIQADVAALRLHLALNRFAASVHKAGFKPGQPRVPSGQPGGGRWTDGGAVIRVGARGRQFIPIGNMPATPAQAARYTDVRLRADVLIRRVQEQDPGWKPSPSLTMPRSIEGQINRALNDSREAQARLAQLRPGHNGGPPLDSAFPSRAPFTVVIPPSQLIQAYRSITGMPDTPLGVAGLKSDRTVAYVEVDGRGVFGVSSDAVAYTVRDEALARDLRSRIIERYPGLLRTDNLGRMPNDALFHAETNALLRAAEPYGGALAGRRLDVYTDRALCRSCRDVLPYVGLQLGNPTVQFRDPHGTISIMRDGRWQR